MARFGIDLTACWRPRTGMGTVAVEMARAMVAEPRGHTFVLFCSRGRPARVEGGEAILSPHLHELANKLYWLPRVESEAGLAAIFYPYWPAPPRRRPGAPPAVSFIHDLAFRLRPAEVPWQQRAYLGSLLPRVLPAAAAVLVPSETTRRDLLASYPIPGLELRVTVVPEGLLLGRAGPLPDGLEPGFILAVGTVEPRKNHARLLAAYAKLSNPPPLVIAGGPGWNGHRLPDQSGVRMLGHADDATLAALYANASVLAFPSLYEGFGLPLLEAMASGLPALIGNRGSLPEVAAGAALEVDAEDVASIASGLERLLGDEGLRATLVAQARVRSAEFTWERAAAQTLDILERVASR